MTISKLAELIWRAGWILLFQLGLLPSVKRASDETRTRRLETCRACPIFQPRFSRCGYQHAFDFETGDAIRLGCGCFMKIKSKIANSKCWSREEGLQNGWPDQINGRDIE